MVKTAEGKEELTLGWMDSVRGESWFITQLTSRIRFTEKVMTTVRFRGQATQMMVTSFYPGNGNSESHAFVPDPRGGTDVPASRGMFVDGKQFDKLEARARSMIEKGK